MKDLYNIENLLSIKAENQGVVRYSLPIAIPPSRGNLNVNVNIKYNSMYTNGIAGVGWQLDEIYIERYLKDFYFMENGIRTKLLQIKGSVNEFILKREYGEYRKFIQNDKIWVIEDGYGTKFYLNAIFEFGYGTFKISRWYPTIVKDSNGNFIKYIYEESQSWIDASIIIPTRAIVRERGLREKKPPSIKINGLILGDPRIKEIHYNHYNFNNKIIPNNRISFEWEERFDPYYKVIEKSFYIVKHRLKRIIIYSSSNIEDLQDYNELEGLIPAEPIPRQMIYRKYDFIYEKSLETSKSLLKAFKESGQDTELPELRFKYSEPKENAFKNIQKSFQLDEYLNRKNWIPPKGHPPIRRLVEKYKIPDIMEYSCSIICDLDGDGKPEIVSTHHCTNDWKWDVMRFTDENCDIFKLPFLLSENNENSEIPIGMRYAEDASSIYPDPEPHHNNRSLISLGLNYRPFEGEKSYELGGLYELKTGNTMLIIPYHYFERSGVYDDMDNLIKVEETLKSDPNKWLFFVSEESFTQSVFDKFSFIDVSNLRSFGETNVLDNENQRLYSCVPLLEATYLKEPEEFDLSETNFTHHTTGEHFTSKFLFDITGDGMTEYISVTKEGKWQYKKLKINPGSNLISFSAETYDWSTPDGECLLPFNFYKSSTITDQNPQLLPNQIYSESGTWTKTFLFDVTGNGCPDLLRADYEKLEIFYNTGESFIRGPLLNYEPGINLRKFNLSINKMVLTKTTEEDIRGQEYTALKYSGTPSVQDFILDINGDESPDFINIRIDYENEENKLILSPLFAECWGDNIEIEISDDIIALGQATIDNNWTNTNASLFDLNLNGLPGFLFKKNDALNFITGYSQIPDLLIYIDDSTSREVNIKYKLLGDFIGDFFNISSKNRRFNRKSVVTEVGIIDFACNTYRRKGFFYEEPVFHNKYPIVERFTSIYTYENTGILNKYQFNQMSGDLYTLTSYYDPIIKEIFPLSTLEDSQSPYPQKELIEWFADYKEKNSVYGEFGAQAKKLSFTRHSIEIPKFKRTGMVYYQEFDPTTGERIDSSQERFYNKYGYVKQINNGRQIIKYDFVQNWPYIGYPIKESIYNNQDQLISMTKFFYDNKPLGYTGSFGNLTRIEREVYSTVNPDNTPLRNEILELYYDKWGNMKWQSQLKGTTPRRIIESVYDPKKLFLIEEIIRDPLENSPIIVKKYEYDLRTHQKIREFLPTNEIKETRYDTLGRISEEYILYNENSPKIKLKDYSYVYTDKYVITEKIFNQEIPVGEIGSNKVSSTTKYYYSSSGKIIQVKTKYPDGTNYIEKAFLYNKDGSISFEIEPHKTELDEFEILLPPNSPDEHINCKYYEYDYKGMIQKEYFGMFVKPEKINHYLKSLRKYSRKINQNRIITTFSQLKNHDDVEFIKTIYESDLSGLIHSVVDSMNQKVEIKYDCKGNITSLIRDQCIYEFEWDSKGKLLRSVDPETFESTRLYDEFGNHIITKSRRYIPSNFPNIIDSATIINNAIDVLTLRYEQFISLLSISRDYEEYFSSIQRLLIETSYFRHCNWIDQLLHFLYENRDVLISSIPPDGLDTHSLEQLKNIFLSFPGGDIYFQQIYYLVKDHPVLERTYDYLDRIIEEKIKKPQISEGQKKTISYIEDPAETVSYIYDIYENSSKIEPEFKSNILGRLSTIITKSRTIELGYDDLGILCQKFYSSSLNDFNLIKRSLLSGQLDSIIYNKLIKVKYNYSDYNLLKTIEITYGGTTNILEFKRNEKGECEQINDSKSLQGFGFENDLVSHTDFKRQNDNSSYIQHVDFDCLSRVKHHFENFTDSKIWKEYIYDDLDRLKRCNQWFNNKEEYPDNAIELEFDSFNNLLLKKLLLNPEDKENPESRLLKKFNYKEIIEKPHFIVNGVVHEDEFKSLYDANGCLANVIWRRNGIFRFEYDHQGRINKMHKGTDTIEFSYDGEGTLQYKNLNGGKPIELFGDLGFYDYEQEMEGYHLYYQSIPLCTILKRNTDHFQLFRHVVDTWGSIIFTYDESNPTSKPMSFNVNLDLSINISNQIFSLDFLPAITRGGFLINLQNTQFLRFGSRIYYPKLEIFLSPDPYLSAYMFYNAYNRYRFGYNDLLNTQDPLGFSVEGIFFCMFLFAIKGAFIGYTLADNDKKMQGALLGALLGAVVGGVAGGVSECIIELATPITLAGKIAVYGIAYAIREAIGGAAIGIALGDYSQIGKYAISGFILGAGQGIMEYFTPLSLAGAVACIGSHTLSSVVEYIWDGDNIASALGWGLAKGLLAYFFNFTHAFSERYGDHGQLERSVGSLPDEYGVMEHNKIIYTAPKGDNLITLKGYFAKLELLGFALNIVSRAICVGFGAGVTAAIIFRNKGAAGWAFIGGTVVGLIIIGMTPLQERYQIDLNKYPLLHGFEEHGYASFYMNQGFGLFPKLYYLGIKWFGCQVYFSGNLKW